MRGQAVRDTHPPPPPWQTCKAVGTGTICEGTNIESEAYDTGVVCGGGASAFDIFKLTSNFARKFFDENGNLVHRFFHDHYTFGLNSNPLTGATVPYTQADTRTDVFAVPGDVSSATETPTWEIEVHSAGGAPLFRNTGRTVQAPGGATLFRAGPLGFWDLFENGDTSVVDPLCAALGAA